MTKMATDHIIVVSNIAMCIFVFSLVSASDDLTIGGPRETAFDAKLLEVDTSASIETLYHTNHFRKIFPPAPQPRADKEPPAVNKVEIAPPSDNFRLLGIIVGDEMSVAILDRGDGSQPARLTTGMAIGKWQVVRIASRFVVLREGLNEQTLVLR